MNNSKILLAGLVVALVAALWFLPGDGEIEAAGGINLDLWKVDDSPAILVTNVTLVDAESGVRAAHDVLMQDGTITAVGPTGSLAISGNETVIDGMGLYAIPGLWDAHVHLTFNEEIGLSALPMFIANGITNVRDTGGVMHKIMPIKKSANDYWYQDTPQSPRVFVAGPLLDGVPTVYNGEVEAFPEIAIGIDTPEKAVETVDAMVEAGVDFIKLYEMLTPEVFEALLARADHHGLSVSSHMPLRLDPADYADPRLTSLEHMRNLEMACSATAEQDLRERRQLVDDQQDTKPGRTLRSEMHSRYRIPSIENEDPAKCDAYLRSTIEAGIIHNPTLALIMRIGPKRAIDGEWAQTFEYLPAAARDKWLAYIAGMDAAVVSGGNTTFPDWARSTVMRLHNMGGHIMAGTDMPIAFLTPGFSLHLELEQLQEAGLSPMEALEAATLTPARFFGIEDEFGSIAPGKVADLVLLSADPSQDIRAAQQIVGVIAGGRYMDQAALDHMLNSAKTVTQ